MARQMRPPLVASSPPAPAGAGRRRRQRRICTGSLVAAGMLYLGSPYAALWAMGGALRNHNQAVLCASLDWSAVRTGLKQSLGLRPTSIQAASQPDELPGFGESFAQGLASGIIDDDVTPARLEAMLDSPVQHPRRAAGLPNGFFTSPAGFEARIPIGGEPPIRISMRIEQWRWKITRIVLPRDMLEAPAATHLASTRS